MKRCKEMYDEKGDKKERKGIAFSSLDKKEKEKGKKEKKKKSERENDQTFIRSVYKHNGFSHPDNALIGSYCGKIS